MGNNKTEHQPWLKKNISLQEGLQGCLLSSPTKGAECVSSLQHGLIWSCWQTHPDSVSVFISSSELQSSTPKDQSLLSLCENDFWLLSESLLALPYSQQKNFPLIGLAKLPLHLFPFLFIFLSPFIFSLCMLTPWFLFYWIMLYYFHSLKNSQLKHYF